MMDGQPSSCRWDLGDNNKTGEPKKKAKWARMVGLALVLLWSYVTVGTKSYGDPWHLLLLK